MVVEEGVQDLLPLVLLVVLAGLEGLGIYQVLMEEVEGGEGLQLKKELQGHQEGRYMEDLAGVVVHQEMEVGVGEVVLVPLVLEVMEVILDMEVKHHLQTTVCRLVVEEGVVVRMLLELMEVLDMH
jgi:hypothetical protein